MQSNPTVRSGILLAAMLLLLGAAEIRADEVPSFVQATGHGFGERITLHHEMVSYLRQLDVASPRVHVEEQGRSWEGRELLLAVVTSPANHARLDEIRADARRLSDPRQTDRDQAAVIIARQPAVLYFGGSIHGFELSGSEGLLRLLEHLTTRDDAETLDVLENTVVLLDPMLNPDGREAFARHNHETLGSQPIPQRDDWANDFTLWEALQFRTGHYFFDTNRDWWAHTQRETQARVPTLREWRPQIVVDLHEMSPDVEFYFDPATEPFGTFYPTFARRWYERFGRAYAAAFDEAGFEYMTRERYNFFYPGYTTSYGSYQGAVGMLYEQGSSRGLALTRADESVRRLVDALEQQYTAAWTAAKTAASQRTALLQDYYDDHRAALDDGRRGVIRYLIRPEGDPNLVAELVDLLLRNGIEVARLTQSVRLGGVTDRLGASIGDREFPLGTYIVEAAQPRNRLVRVLLEPEQPLPEAFLAEARQRVERGQNPRFYDITAWSLPLLFDVAGFASTDRRDLPVERLSVSARVPLLPERNATYAYLFDGRQAASLAALYHLRERGYRAAVALKPTRLEGRDLTSGTVVVRVGQNDDSVHAAVREVASRFRLDLLAVDTGLSEEGFPALGSADVIPIKSPEIAILAGQPVHAYSFGWAWYTLDRQYEIPVTVRRVRSLAARPLDRFNVLLVPHLLSSDELAEKLGEPGLERIRQWVRDGGCLVALGRGVDFVRQGLELGALRSFYPDKKSSESEDGGDEASEEKEEPQHFDVPGAFLRVLLDGETWLAAGYQSEFPALVNSDRVYLEPIGPPDADRRVTGRYSEKERLRLSGHLWPESLERLSGAVFAYEERVGDGRVILFAEDLNFRAYWRGANRLFLNAVVLGPSAP